MSEQESQETQISGKIIRRRPTKRFPKNRKVFTVNHEPSLADQTQKEECDVNNIVAKHYKNRIPFPNNPGMYADVSMISDLQGALDDVRKANEAFDALPSELRARLGNDPRNLISYLNDSRNFEEASNYGLLTITETPAAIPKESAPKKPAKKAQNNDDSNDDE